MLVILHKQRTTLTSNISDIGDFLKKKIKKPDLFPAQKEDRATYA